MEREFRVYVRVNYSGVGAAKVSKGFIFLYGRFGG